MTNPSHDLSISAARTAATAHLAMATAFALAFSCCAVAALAFLDLNEILTAKMTTTRTNAGMDIRPEHVATLSAATVAVLGFVAALHMGVRLTDAGDQGHRRRVPTLLRVAVVLQAAALAAGIAAAGAGAANRLLVIELSAGALALQTAGARRITELGGVTSTYVTSATTSVVRNPRDYDPKHDGDAWVGTGLVGEDRTAHSRPSVNDYCRCRSAQNATTSVRRHPIRASSCWTTRATDSARTEWLRMSSSGELGHDLSPCNGLSSLAGRSSTVRH